MQREIILVVGKTGSGKTTWAKSLFAQTPRALLADAGFQEFPALYFAEYPEFVHYARTQGAFSDFQSSPFRLSYVPFRWGYTPRIVEEPLIFDTAMELGNCVLFLEEADRFEDPRTLQEYDEVISRGRHHGVSIVAVTPHPYGLPKDLRRQATRIIAFNQDEPGDLDYLAARMGDAAYTLPSLPRFTYLDWSPFAPIQKKSLTK